MLSCCVCCFKCFVQSNVCSVCGACCIGFCLCSKAWIYCCFSLIPMLLTLGLWSYARECTFYWSIWLWDGFWPLAGYVLLQTIPLNVFPFLFTFIYSKYLGTSGQDFMKAVEQESSAVNQYMLPDRLQLEETDKYTLIEYNRINLEDDFELPDNPCSQSDVLPDGKVAIVNSTLKYVGTIVIKQVLCIVTVRLVLYMLETPNLGDYFYRPGKNCLMTKAMKLTLLERRWASYTSTLESEGVRSMQHSSKYLNLLWNLL